MPDIPILSKLGPKEIPSAGFDQYSVADQMRGTMPADPQYTTEQGMRMGQDNGDDEDEFKVLSVGAIGGRQGSSTLRTTAAGTTTAASGVGKARARASVFDMQFMYTEEPLGDEGQTGADAPQGTGSAEGSLLTCFHTHVPW